MRRFLLLELIILLCCGAAFGQNSSYTPQLISYNGTPTGTCAIYQQAINTTNGNLYACNMNGNATIGSWVITGGSVPLVTSNPVTCTTGQTFFNTVTGQFLLCPATNTISTAAGGWATVVDAAQFGVKGDGKFSCAASFTNASNVVTTTATEQPFTSADSGSFAYGTNLNCPSGFASSSLAIGTTSRICTNVAVQAHQVSICQADGVTAQNASLTCTTTPGVTGCSFIWAHTDSTVAARAAWVAASTAPCSILLLPAGGIFLTGLIQNPAATCQSSQILPVGVAQATGVRGVGQNATVLLPSPSIDYTAATFANGGAFFAVPTTNSISTSKFMADFSLFGAEAPLINGASAQLFVGQFSSTLQNVAIDEWGFGTAGSTCINWTGIAIDVTELSNVVAFGCNVPCNFQNYIGLSHVICYGGPSVTGTNAVIISHDAQFNGVSGGTAAVTTGGGTLWESFGDFFSGPSGQAGIIGNGLTMNIHGGQVLASGAGIGYKANTGSNILRTVNTSFAATTPINNNAAGVVQDLGGNTYTGGTVVNTGSWVGESLSANGIAVTSAKLVLSANWGTSPTVTALSGGNAPILFTITNGSAATGASPTVTYTFPTVYPVAPFSCTATQIGGTNATGTFTSSALSTTGVTFTFSLTPTATSTEIVQVICVTP